MDFLSENDYLQTPKTNKQLFTANTDWRACKNIYVNTKAFRNVVSKYIGNSLHLAVIKKNTFKDRLSVSAVRTARCFGPGFSFDATARYTAGNGQSSHACFHVHMEIDHFTVYVLGFGANKQMIPFSLTAGITFRIRKLSNQSNSCFHTTHTTQIN